MISFERQIERWLEKYSSRVSRAEFEPGKTIWWRSEKYQTVCHRRRIYVVPESGSRLICYEPLHTPQLFLDVFRLGSDCFRRCYGVEQLDERERRVESIVLEFCHKYGLMGLFWARLAGVSPCKKFVYLHDVHLDEDKEYDPEESLEALRPIVRVDYPKYASRYFRDQTPPDLNLAIYPDSSFLLAYSEPILDIARACVMMTMPQILKESSKEVMDDKHRLDEPHSLFLRDIILVMRRRASSSTMDFCFTSLYMAIGIMSAISQLSPENRVRICALRDCRRPFLGRHARARYCSESCSLRGRVRDFRARKKAEAQASSAKRQVKTPVKKRKGDKKRRTR